MMLDRFDGEEFVFRLSAREKELLVNLLQLYPLVPARHHRFTRGSDPRLVAEQELLDQALAEHRAQNRRQLQAMLNAAGRFRKTSAGCELSLGRGDIEWLLQVLNDIRVGSWLNAGSPDEDQGRPPELTGDNLRHFVAMEIAVAFQVPLLRAIDTGH